MCTWQSQIMQLVYFWSEMRLGCKDPSAMLASPCMKLRHAIYPWKRWCWPLYTLWGSFHIIFRHILWWCSPSFPCKHSYENRITRTESL